jgi:hypothetical protein
MKRHQSLPATLMKAVHCDTLHVRGYEEGRRLSPTLTRGQARDVLAAVLRHLSRTRDCGLKATSPCLVPLEQRPDEEQYEGSRFQHGEPYIPLRLSFPGVPRQGRTE